MAYNALIDRVPSTLVHVHYAHSAIMTPLHPLLIRDVGKLSTGYQQLQSRRHRSPLPTGRATPFAAPAQTRHGIPLPQYPRVVISISIQSASYAGSEDRA